jgi:6-phosphogluconolactonase/glucosamine-6-phosphate isomerase/deaminase
MKLIDEDLSAKLVVMQVDERFVEADSPDSNWHQVIKAGFEPKRASVYPVLTHEYTDVEQAARAYEQVAKEQFSQADFIIAQLGIGDDGHTAGILPGSAGASALELVTGYAAERFERITLTFPALELVDEAYVFAYGGAKLYALTRLMNNHLPLETLPAAILRRLAQAVVYNDQIEGETK